MFSIIVYISSFLLILAYVMIPRRPVMGWGFSFAGNILYTYPMINLHKIELLILPVVFTALAAWNIFREIRRDEV